MNTEKQFLTAQEVAAVCGCSDSKAYKIIREMNAALHAAGYLTLPGKVSSAYFYEKIYGTNAG